MLRIGDPVMMIDRYAARCPGGARSWFHGMRGKVSSLKPYLMVHLEHERLPMVFDERDIIPVEESAQAMTNE